jgi:hypothetical protein
MPIAVRSLMFGASFCGESILRKGAGKRGLNGSCHFGKYI